MSTANLDYRFRKNVDQETRRVAQRTAFIARFIVLREGRRSRAHRKIEEMSWSNDATTEDLYEMFRAAFIENGDKLEPVDRDLNRALAHSKRSVDFFIDQYIHRSCLSFRDALDDYKRSNALLFGDGEEEGEAPRSGGWRI